MLSQEAIDTLPYLEGRIALPVRGYYELTEGGIVRRTLPLRFSSPGALGLVRLPRFRLYNPITHEEMQRVRLWIEPSLVQRVDELLEPYRKPKLPDLEDFIQKNELKYHWQEKIPLIVTDPKQIAELISLRLVRASRPFITGARGTDALVFYDDNSAWKIDTLNSTVDVWANPSGAKEAFNEEKFIFLSKDMVFSILYYSGVANTITMRAEVRRMYRHLGGK